MDNYSAQMIDGKIKKFKEFMDEFEKLFAQGYMSANMIESQHNTLRKISEDMKAKNTEAETNLNKTIAANEMIEAEGKMLKEKAKADVQVLWAKAHAKYKEVESILDSADKKRARESLKELEALAS